MEKACHSSSSTTTSASGGGGDSSATIITTNSDNNRDAYLKHLNKISHKISKPIRKTPPPPPDFTQNDTMQNQEIPPPPPPPPVQLQNQGPQQAQQQQQHQHQHQPPVYNINKNDFRDVVQRLTGSPAHERFSTPPPIQPPKPPSSRLQRIRPPPLAQISNRPTPPLPQISNPGSNNVLNCPNPTVFLAGQRQPLSPLPPFPAVHAAAESPISAYMRFLQGSVSSAASLRWNNLAPVQMPTPPTAVHHHHQQQNIPPPPQGFPQFPTLLPTSPLPFGCIPSPRSPYALLSPSLLFSPTGQLGFPQLPLSPSLPVPSPRWKDI
ncbi:hypothetical protein ACH5RR_026921 [Cinchona calisaya]|uniref:VQ domain-containing protein n=1 Tax=Cinchona calisaya TaxID=153742 RepID=A0ABD2Z548_9GENT